MKMKKLTLLMAGVAATGMIFAGCNNKNNEDGAYSLTDYSSYVTLGEYTGLEADVTTPSEATDEQVQTEIDAILSIYTTQEEITEGVVADGDKINLDYTGYLNGEAFDGGSTDGAGTDYTIGGNYISDLNDQLIGLEVGKEYDLECTFPEDYGNEELNGQTVIFTVTVNCIYGEDIVPEWNDELVETYTSGDYTSVEAFESDLRASLTEQNLEDQILEFEYVLWASIIENCTISGYPEDVLTTYTDDYYNYYKEYYTYVASYYGLTYEEYLDMAGFTDEELKEDCVASAKSELEFMMVSSEIAKAQNISMTKEEYEAEVSSIVEEYTYESNEEFLEQYSEHPANYLYESFIFEKVTEYLKENNTMVLVDSTEDATTE